MATTGSNKVSNKSINLQKKPFEGIKKFIKKLANFPNDMKDM